MRCRTRVRSPPGARASGSLGACVPGGGSADLRFRISPQLLHPETSSTRSPRGVGPGLAAGWCGCARPFGRMCVPVFVGVCARAPVRVWMCGVRLARGSLGLGDGEPPPAPPSIENWLEELWATSACHSGRVTGEDSALPTGSKSWGREMKYRFWSGLEGYIWTSWGYLERFAFSQCCFVSGG